MPGLLERDRRGLARGRGHRARARRSAPRRRGHARRPRQAGRGPRRAGLPDRGDRRDHRLHRSGHANPPVPGARPPSLPIGARRHDRVSLRLELVDRGARRRAHRRAYHRRVVDGARGQAFIGREAELGRLARAYARATAGESRVVVVGGEAGIGKSRLVATFADEVGGSGARVLGRRVPPARDRGASVRAVRRGVPGAVPRRRPGCAAGAARTEPRRAGPADARGSRPTRPDGPGDVDGSVRRGWPAVGRAIRPGPPVRAHPRCPRTDRPTRPRRFS